MEEQEQQRYDSQCQVKAKYKTNHASEEYGNRTRQIDPKVVQLSVLPESGGLII